ncbi:Crp/Fnr family transcriptional regulator [Chloroflexota bacterium]
MNLETGFTNKIFLFSGLEEQVTRSFVYHFFEKRAVRGELFQYEGEPAQAVYFVLSGVVKVYKTSADGKEQIIYLVRPGEMVNVVSTQNDANNLASAEAMGEVVLAGILPEAFEKVLAENSQLTPALMAVVAERVKQLLRLVEDLSFRNVAGRVAKVLLENASSGDKENQRLTQQEMAAMIGTAREMVGRAIKTLEDDGLIRLDRHRIVISDEWALREVAGLDR